MTVPGRDVLDAFRLTGSPVALPGGEGRSVRVGDVVLKPAGDDQQSAEWLARTMVSIPEQGFRISRPLQTPDGAWTHRGWTASRYIPGDEPAHDTAPRWLEIIAAGRAFHRALAGLPRPDFLDRRSDWWETGSKVAWQEREPDLIAGLLKPYMELSSLLVSPLREQPQLIHGDLTGNVLFAPGLAPAVIDFSPYWRPAAFGEAVVVGDALIWHGADGDLLRQAASDSGADFIQFVARAVIYRLVTTSERCRSLRVEGSPDTVAELSRYERAASLITDFARY
jgi:uncharacterized protein (TIGR02569 family)